MDVEELKKKINNVIDDWADGYKPNESKEAEPARELPKDKRVVRTKASGDRVYFIDEVKKTRQWVTNPEILKSLGFEMSDVTEVNDAELLKYQMGSALYRVEGA